MTAPRTNVIDIRPRLVPPSARAVRVFGEDVLGERRDGEIAVILSTPEGIVRRILVPRHLTGDARERAIGVALGRIANGEHLVARKEA